MCMLQLNFSFLLTTVFWGFSHTGIYSTPSLILTTILYIF